MKLEINGTEAIITCSCLASFFVLSLYMWIPCDKARFKKKEDNYDENSKEELLKRITSVFFTYLTFRKVVCLSALAITWLYIRGSHEERPVLNFIHWLGL